MSKRQPIFGSKKNVVENRDSPVKQERRLSSQNFKDAFFSEPLEEMKTAAVNRPKNMPPIPPKAPNKSQVIQQQKCVPTDSHLMNKSKVKSQTGSKYIPGQNRNINKLITLNKFLYINPLARLDYEDREIEVYTKLSKQSQKSAVKKILSRNQLAEFDDEEEEERNIDDLIEFKFGKSGKNSFITYFQKEQVKTESGEEIASLVTAQKSMKEQQFLTYGNEVYCLRCDTLMSKAVYEEFHKPSCDFCWSEDPTRRNEQLIDKFETIYNMLKDFSSRNATIEQFKQILVDITFENDPKKLEYYTKKVKVCLQSEEGLIGLLRDRTVKLIQLRL